MKILAVGMNYAAHTRELHGEGVHNEEPVIFMKPDSSLLQNGKPFFLPDFSERVDYETELVVRISRLGKCISQRFASRYYDQVTVGIDFTARDIQNRAREKGNPWLLSKGFDGASAIGSFVSTDKFQDLHDLHFHLDVDGHTVQQGYTGDMLFKIDEIVAYVSKFMTLKMGDLIFTGTPVGVGPVAIDQHLEGYLEDEKLLDFYVR